MQHVNFFANMDKMLGSLIVTLRYFVTFCTSCQIGADFIDFTDSI